MKPSTIYASNSLQADIIISATHRDVSKIDNRRLPNLSGLGNTGLYFNTGTASVDDVPGENPHLVTPTIPQEDSASLAKTQDMEQGPVAYTGKKAELSESLFRRRPAIATINDFRTALGNIHGGSRSDQARSLGALSGSLLNLQDHNRLHTAIVEFIQEARPQSYRHPSLKALVDALVGIKDNRQLIRKFSGFILQQFKTENNCLKIAVRYGITNESFLFCFEHSCFGPLFNEEMEQKNTPREIAAKSPLSTVF